MIINTKAIEHFFTIQSEALEDLRLTLNDRWIYCCAAFWANKHGEAQDTDIVNLSGCTLEEIQTALKKLVEYGYLV